MRIENKILCSAILICGALLNVKAQEGNLTSRNFGFEILENDQPVGWTNAGSGDYEVAIDSVLVHSGKKSLVIEQKGEASGYYLLGYSIPTNYDEKKVTVSGYMKTENVSDGSASLWMRVEPNLEASKAIDFAVSGTTAWTKYQIELPLDPSKATEIKFGGLLIGKGKVWLDDFELTIDGKKLDQATIYVKPLLEGEVEGQILSQLSQHAQEVSLDSDVAYENSLSGLVEAIGEKKIIGIGEDTHGTGDHYKARIALTKKLIREKGFNVVVLENPYDDIEMLTQQLGKEEINSLMRKHLFSIYQTEEMKSFLEWLYANGLNTKVAFKGCDDSFWLLPEMVKNEITNLRDETLSTFYAKSYEKMIREYDTYVADFLEVKDTWKGEMAFGKSVYEDILEIEKQLEKHTEKYSPKLREMIANLKNSYAYYNGVVPISRDGTMAERVSYFAQNPEAKVIFWAHSAHVSNQVIIGGEIGLMGANLKKEFGDDYYAIGLSSLNGTYSYMENRFINNDHTYDDTLLQGTFVLQPLLSWENTFSKVKLAAYYFESKKVSTDFKNAFLKLAGYGKETETDYYELNPLDMFDAVIFQKTTKATTPLKN